MRLTFMDPSSFITLEVEVVGWSKEEDLSLDLSPTKRIGFVSFDTANGDSCLEPRSFAELPCPYSIDSKNTLSKQKGYTERKKTCELHR